MDVSFWAKPKWKRFWEEKTFSSSIYRFDWDQNNKEIRGLSNLTIRCIQFQPDPLESDGANNVKHRNTAIEYMIRSCKVYFLLINISHTIHQGYNISPEKSSIT